jgi:hypothetical protein
VHGPAYATGVGLVKYGARAVTEASLMPGVASVPPPPRLRMPSHVEVAELQRSGFWEWIKAAF